jgi:predicted nucleic acid-binding protein
VSILVLDCSAAIALRESDSATAQDIRDSEIYSPQLIDLEFVSVIRKFVARGEMSLDDGTQLVSDWSSNGVVRCVHAPYLRRIWQLRDNFTSYDASYVALAEHLGFPLVTADLRLAKSAERYCEVVTFGTASA